MNTAQVPKTAPASQTLAPEAVSKIELELPQFIATRRWFRAKTRNIHGIAIRDVVPFSRARSYVLIAAIQYETGEPDNYVIAISFEGNESDAILQLDSDAGEGRIYDALGNPAFRAALLDAFACDETFAGTAGELIARRTSVFEAKCGAGDLKLESSVSRAEQSNTSILYGDRFIFKLFRKIEPGINPDLEIGVFLTEHGFEHTPAVLGTFEYRSHSGENYALGILQTFVPNRGDAWKYTLESLGEFFPRALSSGRRPPPFEAAHPLDLAERDAPSELRDLIGGYVESARLLGVRTAEMHAALADPAATGDFAPEPFAPEDGGKLYQEMLVQAHIAFELLRSKQNVLQNEAARTAQEVLQLENRITGRFARLRDEHLDAVRIRFHGDYHLGQVLYTGSDFMIIDFEGEPARPLHERRTKTLAMRDVAGMLRSFQYAAYAALAEHFRSAPQDSNVRETMGAWAAAWNAWIGATFLNGYFSHAARRQFVPADQNQRRLLLDAFLLHKALYEVAYELNNRPDWVRIPLEGILTLVR